LLLIITNNTEKKKRQPDDWHFFIEIASLLSQRRTAGYAPVVLRPQASVFRTVRLLYVPQFLHALWGMRSSPHLGQATKLGVESFQWEERLLSLLAFDTFLLGTAIYDTSC
jgi:hypothetical protein